MNILYTMAEFIAYSKPRPIGRITDVSKYDAFFGNMEEQAKSLKVYMDTYKPDFAMKLSSKNFGFEDGKKTVPLYAAFCI